MVSVVRGGLHPHPSPGQLLSWSRGLKSDPWRGRGGSSGRGWGQAWVRLGPGVPGTPALPAGRSRCDSHVRGKLLTSESCRCAAGPKAPSRRGPPPPGAPASAAGAGAAHPMGPGRTGSPHAQERGARRCHNLGTRGPPTSGLRDPRDVPDSGSRASDPRICLLQPQARHFGDPPRRPDFRDPPPPPTPRSRKSGSPRALPGSGTSEAPPQPPREELWDARSLSPLPDSSSGTWGSGAAARPVLRGSPDRPPPPCPELRGPPRPPFLGPATSGAPAPARSPGWPGSPCRLAPRERPGGVGCGPRRRLPAPSAPPAPLSAPPPPPAPPPVPSQRVPTQRRPASRSLPALRVPRARSSPCRPPRRAGRGKGWRARCTEKGLGARGVRVGEQGGTLTQTQRQRGWGERQRLRRRADRDL